MPVDRWLVDNGFVVTGLDISEVHVQRARALFPFVTFECGDLARFDLKPGSLDAVIRFYVLIQVALAD